MAPVLLLPVLGSSLPLPLHLSLVFLHAFVVVPFAAGIYPSRMLDVARMRIRLDRRSFIVLLLRNS